MDKEYLYVGYYYDTNGHFMLKVGTTNDLKRRKTEHTRNYRRAKQYTLPQDKDFEYLWNLPLSKYNTLRYEDKTRKAWQEQSFGEFVRNDRFCCSATPHSVEVKIRKTYNIPIKGVV